MNKSILIVVCDFLVLSLLSFVSFDTAMADEGELREGAAVLGEVVNRHGRADGRRAPRVSV